MAKKGIHHVELYVSDLGRSKEFWGWFLDLLDYEVQEEWDQGISYRLGTSYIVFVQTEDRHQEPKYHRCKTGLNHLAFHAESRDQVDHLTEVLRSKGMKILYEDKHPYAGGEGYYAVFFEDPDRIKIELVAP